MTQNVLVTGATGLLGNNFVRQWLAAGNQAEVLVRSSSNLHPLQDIFSHSGQPLIIHQGDVTDIDSIRRAARNVTHIVHAAGDVHIGWKGIERQRTVNVQGALNIAQVARENKLRLLHVSSINALGLTGTDEPATELTPFGPHNVPTTYVVTKREADEAIDRMIDQGLNATIVHPGFMLGPYDWKPSSGRMLLELEKNYGLFAPAGCCSLTDARDVATGMITALLHGLRGEHYILAGHNLSYFELWRRISRLTGCRPPITRLNHFSTRMIGWLSDIYTALSGRETELNSGMMLMSAKNHFYSSDKARVELGYTVRSIDEIIQDAWNWLKRKR